MSSVPVVIIDYGMGNLRSVVNAFHAVGGEAVLSRDPSDLRRAERIVLPGVGAFGDGMAHLRAAGWIDPLAEEVLERRKPFLGLCLGMQLLAATGTEHGHHEGLGWIPGVVRRIRNDDQPLRVPHIGWNDVQLRSPSELYAGLGESQTFYFVHSYVFEVEDQSVVTGSCDYGGRFAASVEYRNVHATQFHPEKSQKAGLHVLRNFLALPADA